MLFRPEEGHGRSGIGRIVVPLLQRHGNVGDQVLRINPEQLAVFDLNLYGFTAVQTRCVDLNRFSRKKPADCQRLKRSLAKPLLLTIDSNPKLSRQMVERCERRYEIRIGIQPSVNSGGEKIMQRLSPLLH